MLDHILQSFDLLFRLKFMGIRNLLRDNRSVRIGVIIRINCWDWLIQIWIIRIVIFCFSLLNLSEIVKIRIFLIGIYIIRLNLVCQLGVVAGRIVVIVLLRVSLKQYRLFPRLISNCLFPRLIYYWLLPGLISYAGFRIYILAYRLLVIAI
jgi:hypothetical protein